MKSFYWPSFSLEGKEKLLVYEFVPNKSLDYFIFDPTKKAQLDWDRQYKIIRGIARGVLSLYQCLQNLLFLWIVQLQAFQTCHGKLIRDNKIESIHN
ncbi:hypothetical protein GLYMA_09G255150v4 [Glycine max]|nr:hypothetical protein GLYMA_09G255150v4 [Glycine max]KAH1044777.1 hypothetical protein GYH30_026167 [Glycine max]